MHAHTPQRYDVNLQIKIITFKALGGEVTSRTGALDNSQVLQLQSITQKNVCHRVTLYELHIDPSCY